MLPNEDLARQQAREIDLHKEYLEEIPVRSLAMIEQAMLNHADLGKALDTFYKGKSYEAFLEANGIPFLIGKQNADTKGMDISKEDEGLWSARVTLTIKDRQITLSMENPYYRQLEHNFYWKQESKWLEIHKWEGKFQGQGLGTALFEAVLHGAVQLGLEDIRLNAIRHDRGDVGYIVWPKWGFDAVIPLKFWDNLEDFRQRVERELPNEREKFAKEAKELQEIIDEDSNDEHLKQVFSEADADKEAFRQVLYMQIQQGAANEHSILAHAYVTRYFYIQKLEVDEALYRKHFSGLRWLRENRHQLNYIQEILLQAPGEPRPDISALWAHLGDTLWSAIFPLDADSKSWRIFEAYKASKAPK